MSFLIVCRSGAAPRNHRCMKVQRVNKRRKSFDKAHHLLEELRRLHAKIQQGKETTARELEPLRFLQKLLIAEIIRAERKIRRSKEILRSLNERDVERAEELELRIAGYRHLAHLWRSFGDAVAFLMMDKYALKQTFFNTHNLNAKQDAGFLLEKEGLAGELQVMEDWLAIGVPALLTDLTNTIRHGDVCLMLGPDPHLIEVKSSELDRRGRRQRDGIRQLMDFYETDEAINMRGLERINRVAHETEEVNYIGAINECIASARVKGAAWQSPEKGLYYLVVTDNTNIHDIAKEFRLKQPLGYPLNEMKVGRNWAPYYPFVLSIRDADALFRFVWGEIYIVVYYDFDALLQLAKSMGFEVELLSRDKDHALELKRKEDEENIRLAWQMFDRVAFDFTSPAWLLANAVERFNSLASGDEPASDSEAIACFKL